MICFHMIVALVFGKYIHKMYFILQVQLIGSNKVEQS